MNSLTIEEIHKIREEHALLTQNMSFIEYKTNLCKEVKPILDLLKSMREKNEPSLVAEPPATYQSKGRVS